MSSYLKKKLTIKRQEDKMTREFFPQITQIFTNQFVKFVRFVGNKKLMLLCYSVF